MLTPIAVFAYNRPQHLQLTLEALERSLNHLKRDLPVFLFCDAPKNELQQQSVEATHKVALMWAQKKQWSFIPREKNYGFNNITEGITALTTRYGSAIIVEDDVVVSPDFLLFMTEGLERYRDAAEVFMISGFMYYSPRAISHSSFFLPHSFIWGWATWQRAWQHYDKNAEGWENFLAKDKERYRFDFYGGFPFSKMLSKTLRGGCTTWDIQWMYTLHKHKALALYPPCSLVWNTGVGGGTHGKKTLVDPYKAEQEEYIHGNLTLTNFYSPRLSSIDFPTQVKVDERAFRALSALFYKQRARFQKRILKKLLYNFKAFFMRALAMNFSYNRLRDL